MHLGFCLHSETGLQKPLLTIVSWCTELNQIARISPIIRAGDHWFFRGEVSISHCMQSTYGAPCYTNGKYRKGGGLGCLLARALSYPLAIDREDVRKLQVPSTGKGS